MVHLRQLGYRLQQVGQVFLVHFPHSKSEAMLAWEISPPQLDENGAEPKDVAKVVDYSTFLRGKVDRTYLEFQRWLQTNVPNKTILRKCEDFEDDDASLWVNP
jgi:hypothetical protein